MQAKLRAAAVEDPPLIETRLAPPRSRPNVLWRGRLLESLDRSAPAALTLVDAPVGFGKSILVQSWCKAQSGAAVAWLSLDAADNDPARLWTYLATAVDRIRPGLGRPALKRLRGATPHITSAVDELANALAGYGDPVVIALDDLHLLEDVASIGSVEYALEHLPASTRIVATTRAAPPMRLSRMRAHGELAEVHSGELAFTLGEARELLVEREGIKLGDDGIEQLVEHTEGWPAGLYLAALWLRGLDDPQARVREFTGNHRHVADYLTGEVLDMLAPDQRAFLLQTSLLPRFTASLCDAVLERSDSAAMLDELARSNMFLVPLDARAEWYRYHHLFAELLQLELDRSDPTARTALGRRAAAWFRQRDLIPEAMHHFSAAGDDDAVADLLCSYSPVLFRSGQAATLLHWTEGLPEERLFDPPELLLGGALAAGLLGRPAAQRERFLALAERAREERPESWRPYTEGAYWAARAMLMDGDVGATVAAAHIAAPRAEGTIIDVPTVAFLAYALLMSGDLLGARTQAERAIGLPDALERPQGHVQALAVLSLVEADEAHPERAEATARKALRFAKAAGIDHSWIGGLAYVALAVALAGCARLSEAESAAERGESLRRAAEPTVENVQAKLVLAGIRAARGRLPQATAELADARATLAGFADPGSLTDAAERVHRTIDQVGAVRDAHLLADAPTAAELRILQLLDTELSQREIGEQLFLSMNTVKSHTRELYRKLGASSRSEAVARAAALGLLQPDESPG